MRGCSDIVVVTLMMMANRIHTGSIHLPVALITKIHFVAKQTCILGMERRTDRTTCMCVQTCSRCFFIDDETNFLRVHVLLVDLALCTPTCTTSTSLPFINRITSNVRHYKPKLFIIATLPRVLLLAFPRCISGSVTIINHFVPAWFIKASRWYSRTTTPTRKQLSQQEQDGRYSYQSHQRCGDIDDTNPAIFRPRPWPRGAAALSGAIAAAAATHERRLECCNNATGAVTEKFWR